MTSPLSARHQALRPTLPPSGVNLTPLDIRLTTTCFSFRASAHSHGKSFGICSCRSTVPGSGALRHEAGDGAQQLDEVDLLLVPGRPAGFDLRHVEDIVDDAEQVAATVVDGIGIVGIAVVAERAE